MIREQVTLVYMPGRGMADSIRLLLDVGGWVWDEYHPDSREDFLALKIETDIAPRYLPSLDRALSDNVDGDGFCGTSLSFIDLQAFAALSFLRDFHEDAFDDPPRLHDLVDRIATLPGVVSFLQRRFGLPDAAYVAHCKSIVVGP